MSLFGEKNEPVADSGKIWSYSGRDHILDEKMEDKVQKTTRRSYPSWKIKKMEMGKKPALERGKIYKSPRICNVKGSVSCTG